MDLLKPLPVNRSLDQIRNHYLVEKAIAERLKVADQQERKSIYATMYDELFQEVPDHPRLTRRKSEAETVAANRSKLALIAKYLRPHSFFVEFAAGDCRLTMEVARYVKAACAVDISDQRDPLSRTPQNFTLVVYDGYQLDAIKDSSVDVMFSDQFIEHLHPEDASLHFRLAFRLLKPGGKYIFRTPHALTGPHDISQYFCEKPQGFHLKEWTFVELKELLRELNFRKFHAIRVVKGVRLRLPYLFVEMCEQVFQCLPRSLRHVLAKPLLSSICIVASK